MPKKKYWNALPLLALIIFAPLAIYLSLIFDRNKSYDEDYTGIIINKFISESNRDAHVIVTSNSLHYNENHYVGTEIYDSIEIGDSVRKIKSDTAFIIKVYKLNTDSNKTMKTLIRQW